MKQFLFGFMLVFYVISSSAFALDVTRDQVYKACLAVEIKHATADGMENPELAAHYLCTIVANDCVAKPDGKQCLKAKQNYELNSADDSNQAAQKNATGQSNAKVLTAMSKEDLAQVFRDVNAGNVKAQAYLGYMYYNGVGVPVDYHKAAFWWRKAAEQNHVRAQVNLGNMLATGEKIPADHAEAVKWYHKAAEQGNAQAMFGLGSSFYYGDGVPKDIAEARKWYQKAADLGDEQAKTALSAISEEVQAGRDETQPNRDTAQPDKAKVQPALIDSEFGIFKILMGLVLLCLVYVVFFNIMIKCKRLSLVIAPLMLFLLVFYYEPWMTEGCTGECNIRVDWIIVGPTIAAILIIAVVNAGILWVESKRQNKVKQK